MLDEIGGLKAVRGASVYGFLEFEGRCVPLVVTTGVKAGPTLLVTGLQHTGEFAGPAALDAWLNSAVPAALNGTVIALPIMNPMNYSPALDPVAHHSAGKHANLNRQWPGDSDSDNALSRLAAFLWEQVVSRADALLDLHCCRACDPFFAACLAGHEASLKLAQAMKFEAVDLQTPASYAPNLLFMEVTSRLGLPALLMESSPEGFQPQHTVAACEQALLRAMVHLGLLAALPSVRRRRVARQAPVFSRADRATEIMVHKGGYLGIRRWAGERVKTGEVVAEVRTVDTFEVVERLISPLDGVVACAGDPAGAGFIKAGITGAVVKATY